MKKSIVLCGLFLGLGVILGFTLSRCADGPRHRDRWEKKMDLSTTEKEQVKELFKNDKEQVKTLMDSLDKASEELKIALADKTSTDETLRAKFEAFHQIRKQLTDRRFELNLKIRKLIGPEKMKNFDVLGPQPPHGPRGKKGPRAMMERGEKSLPPDQE